MSRQIFMRPVSSPVTRAGLVLIALLFAFASGCTVDSTYIKEGYEESERHWLKRIAIAIQNSGDVPSQDVQRLYLSQATKHISFHNEYIIPKVALGVEASEVGAICEKADVDGVLLNRFLRLERVMEEGEQPGEMLSTGEVEIEVEAMLIDCRSQATVWSARGSNDYDSEDEDMRRLTQSYISRHGEVAEIYASPFYKFIRQLYDSMPDPVLEQDEIDEKIDVDALGPDELQ